MIQESAMRMSNLLTSVYARLGIADARLRSRIDQDIAQIASRLAPQRDATTHFIAWMNCQSDRPAKQTHALPAAFFEAVFGPQMHTGSAFYATGGEAMMQAEHDALQRVCESASLANGQEILDFGCGWGGLTLMAAEAFPQSHITALTQSHRQFAYVQAQAMARGLSNVTVVCSDPVEFEPQSGFDRIVALNMFGQIANWRAALTRLHAWLQPHGRAFLQVPTHITTPYAPQAAEDGPLAPRIVASQGLIRNFGDLFTVESEQHWSGTHVARTAMQWLENFDRNQERIGKILRTTYGARAADEMRTWRLALLQLARTHGHAFGDVWGVGNYTLAPADGVSPAQKAAGTSGAILVRH
jgi:cyclopropane-fatty-acyl-phospholipid synthase